MRHAALVATVSLALGTGACQMAETPEQMQARMDQESTAFTQILSGTATRWESWYAAGQADSVANIFMEQGREMPPNLATLVGRDAIRANLAQYFAMGAWTLDVMPEASMANGPLGIDRGRFKVTFTPATNAPPEAAMVPPVDSGKYMIHWHQVNGTWMVADLIYNSDLPMPMPEPARRR
jgi:ketosteroid isomerase-like protein